MKELSIEEKAKRYDEAIKVAKDSFNYPDYPGFIRADVVFPELKKSDDEKIRCTLINHFKTQVDLSKTWNGLKNTDILAYLEKQGSCYDFEIKSGNWYKCICDYMLNGTDLMFKNGRLYYCRIDWRLASEIDERNVKNIGVNGYKSFFRPATNQEIEDWIEKQGEQKLANSKIIDLDELIIELEGTIGTSPHSRETIKDFFQKAVQKYMKCLQIANGEIGRLMDENYYLREQKPAKWIQELEEKLANATPEQLAEWKEKYFKEEPADKIEPKFNGGDWIISDLEHVNKDFCLCKIIDIEGGCYRIQSVNGCKGYNTFDVWENDYRLWTIADAKDGDVLANNGNIILFKEIAISQEPYYKYIECYCFVLRNCSGKVFFEKGAYNLDDNFYPATKKQRDTFFVKMKEAGYKWDADKKELKKIESKKEDTSELTEFEDELFSIMSDVWQGYVLGEEVNIVEIVKDHSSELLERAIKQKSVWNEEDEKRISKILNALEAQNYYNGASGKYTKPYEEEINWLKFLKDKYIWKPSEGQMTAIQWAVRRMKESTCYNSELVSLMNDLNKL